MDKLNYTKAKFHSATVINSDSVIDSERTVSQFISHFDAQPEILVKVPGRIEIIGNHTDHQNGKVIASTVKLSLFAAARKNNSSIVSIHSDGFPTSLIDLSKLNDTEICNSLPKGIIITLNNLGINIGGVDIYINSNIPAGGGLSSSAAFELAVIEIFNLLFNLNLTPIQKSVLAKEAENNFMAKESGLMDQLTISSGGTNLLDFSDSDHPIVEKLNISFITNDYAFVLIDSLRNHHVDVDEYNKIKSEMLGIAKTFGKMNLRMLSRDDLLDNLSSLSAIHGDRAILRALHYFDEVDRVEKLHQAIIKEDAVRFLKLINESGNSSFKWLQNIKAPGRTISQKLNLIFYFCEQFVKDINSGAVRIHGGGFGGTVLVVIPKWKVEEFTERIKKHIPAVKFYMADIDSEGIKNIDLESELQIG